MTQGELEKLPLPVARAFSNLEVRIMADIVRRIKINGFSTAGADWQITRLQQLGESEKEIKKWIREALQTSEEEVEKIFSDAVYEQYMGHERAYKINGMKQMPYEQNANLQKEVEAIKRQTNETFQNITGSLGFVKQNAAGKTEPVSLTDFYRNTLDIAMYDIHSGAFNYQEVLMRTITDMTKSGLRWIDYETGWHNRVDVAARRAVMTGFRQVQGMINEQVAEDIGTDMYEVTYHVGARPEHQPWQGKVWSKEQLRTVCGLGEVTGLHGANCYHDYNAFIPGVSVRTYTDKELEEMIKKENTPQSYNGKEYTTYKALQQQRKMETAMRKTRQDIKLMEAGEADPESIMLKKGRYYGQMETYKDFSDKMDLPMQKDRIYQDGLKGNFSSKAAWEKTQKNAENKANEKYAAKARERKTLEITNSNKRVYYNPQHSYKVEIQGYPDDVNRGISEAALDVAKKGSTDGYEHMHLVDLGNGKTVFYETNQEEKSVGYKFWKTVQNNPDTEYAFIHNHNWESSLSETDLLTVVTTQNIPVMVAVQNDGVIYYVRRKKMAPEDFYPDDYFNQALKELNNEIKNGTITPAQRSSRREELMVKCMLEEFFDGMVIIDERKK